MDQKKEKKFFPEYLFEITVTAFFTVEAVLILSVLFPSAIGREIDFSAQFSPRPEWYFLFLYELTKYFPGRWTFVGAVLLPGLALAFFFLAPFLDGGTETRLSERKTAAACGIGLLVSITALTVISLL